jgi:hypothetical protein
MKVLITGATGLIGSAIVKQCHENNIVVHYLTTSKNKLKNDLLYKGFYWNPEKGEIDTNCFEGVETIINLSGATISQRWTQKHKKIILDSRLQSLSVLKHALSKQSHQVKHLISASGIGAYPDSLTNYYDESYPATSQTFLGKVVREWEEAANSFNGLGIKVAKIRIGLVLSTKGGALPEMVKLIRIGLGAAFGSGEQWQSWIHINDLANLFVFVMEHHLEGIYNAVASNPVTNSELTKSIARILNKPLFLPNIPKSVMKLILGEMHLLLFESQRVCSKKIEKEGFHFKYNNVESALIDLLA